MKKIARKYFLPILLGSVFIFAIDMVEVHASPASLININHDQLTSSFVRLEDGEFWSKFRDSVMKDKDKENKPQPPNNPDDSPQQPPPPNEEY